MRLGGSLSRSRPSGRPPRKKTGASGERRRDWSGTGRVALLAAAVVVAGSSVGYLYATHVVFPLPQSGAEEYREVPDLRGLRIDEATAALRAVGLEPGPVDSISHPARDPGLVVGQDPFPGQLALPSGTVAMTLSTGADERAVPDVSGMRADRAMTVLQTSGFEVVVDSVEVDLPVGRVVGTTPEAGEQLSLPARVRLTVSLGPPGFAMPDLVGLDEDEARVVLDSLGLVVVEIDRTFTFTRSGEIMSHSPPADSLVAPGAEIRLEIGRGFGF